MPDVPALGRPVDVLVIGAGARGAGYADIVAANPELGRIVAVAERNPVRRARFAERHHLPPERVFETWEEALTHDKLADLAIVATQDAFHVDPAIACARAGYHLMLEKPVAPTEDEVRQVVAAVREAGVLMGVCHVLRYTPHTVALQRELAAGAIGDIVSVEHLEPVGYWHFGHSFVRGNWRNLAESSFMLLAKSIHDIDWLIGVVGKPLRQVSSFGSLMHFRPENQPEGAGDRCLECPEAIERACPYSAKRLYLTAIEQGQYDWPVSVITDDRTEAGVRAALRDGPYGRCVYRCDNDVVDHQVVQMEFDGGVTASFTTVAFAVMRGRNTRIFGTMGELTTDSQTITIDDFRTGERRTIDTSPGADGSQLTGHGGGDEGLVVAMLTAVRDGRPDLVSSDAEASLESHVATFAAERARLHGSVEPVVTG